jgi:hypothetical protein
MSDDDTTLEGVLICDVCRGQIDDVDRGMLFWDTAGYDGPVTELVVAHKRCDRPRGAIDRLGLSADLAWLAEPSAALFQLARLVTCYRWNAEQLRRLALVACTAPSALKKWPGNGPRSRPPEWSS